MSTIFTAGAAANATADAVALFSARAALYATESATLTCLQLVEFVQCPAGSSVASIIGTDSANPGVSIRQTYSAGQGQVKSVVTVGVVPNSPLVVDSQYSLQATV
ncbi:MAG TPA: hypothetical protein VHX65_01540 [Pirellulales bacterium]|jgi:hypothetical protein|nr:hypothetical protein [Pirellulales bacterium]